MHALITAIEHAQFLGQPPPPPAPPENPFQGVKPDASVFGAAFNTVFKRLLAGLWGLGFLISAAQAVIAALSLHYARRNGFQSQLAERTEHLRFWGLALGVMVLLPVIYGGVLLATAP
jgi:hypothetical protein